VLKEISIRGLKGYDKFVFQLGTLFQPEISLRLSKILQMKKIRKDGRDFH